MGKMTGLSDIVKDDMDTGNDDERKHFSLVAGRKI